MTPDDRWNVSVEVNGRILPTLTAESEEVARRFCADLHDMLGVSVRLTTRVRKMESANDA